MPAAADGDGHTRARRRAGRVGGARAARAAAALHRECRVPASVSSEILFSYQYNYNACLKADHSDQSLSCMITSSCLITDLQRILNFPEDGNSNFQFSFCVSEETTVVSSSYTSSKDTKLSVK